MGIEANSGRMDAWVVTRDYAGAGSYFSLVKGKRAHLVVLQDGSISTGSSGRLRTGMWEGGRRHFSSLDMLIDGRPCGELFSKYVRMPHATYRSYGEVERVDFMQYGSPLLCIMLESNGEHDIQISFRAEHMTMWPEERRAEDYSFDCSGDDLVLRSSVNATKYVLKGGKLSFGEGRVIASIPSCRRATLLVCGSGAGESDCDYNLNKSHNMSTSEQCILETPDFSFNKVFYWAKHDLLEFFSETEVGSGFYAGFPEFSWFFGRDGEWMSMAAVECGLPQLASAHLATLQSASVDGRLPHEIPIVGNSALDAASLIPTGYMSIDSSPLWVMASILSACWTGKGADRELLGRTMDFIQSCDRDGDGLIENSYGERLIGWPESWAERRDGPCIDANAWWLESLRGYNRLTGKMGDLLKRGSKAFDEAFLENADPLPVVADSLSPHGKRFIKNAAEVVPSIYEGGPKYRAVVDYLGSRDSLTGWGLRSVSAADATYDGGYHTGQVWPLMTGWFVLAAYRNGRGLQAFNAMKSFVSLSRSSPDPGRINEAYHSECMLSTGQFAQGWSSSLFIQCVIEGLFGMRPDIIGGGGGLDSIVPCLPAGWHGMAIRKLRYLGSSYDVEVSSSGTVVRNSD